MGKLTLEEKNILKKAFFDPNHAGSYTSPQKLYESLEKQISLAKIKNFLRFQDSYTLQRNIKRKFKRNQVIAPFIDYQYDVDTANMTFYAKNNKNVHILFIIDIFSRYLWTIPLKTLTGNEMSDNLKKAFSVRKPMKMRSDGGSEFVNNKVKKVLEDLGIDHIITKNETKANYAERVIRSIKEKMGKYMEEKETNEWENILDKMTRSYNHTPHRTIGMRPINVNKSNEIDLWNKLFGKIQPKKESKSKPPKTRIPRYKFKIGDNVRISMYKTAFDKASLSHKWTTEVFVIIKRYIKQGKAIYELEDYAGDKVTGRFYEPELQKISISPNKSYKIEKILKKRKIKGKTEHFVKFKGWPKKYNSWVTGLESI